VVEVLVELESPVVAAVELVVIALL